MNNNIESVLSLEEKKKQRLKEYGISKEVFENKTKKKKKNTKKDNELSKELFDTLNSKTSSPDIKKIEALIKDGADVNYKEKEKGNYPLLICARKGYDEIAALLINNGADINLANDFGTTALMAAARHDNYELCEVLLILGADINAQCIDGDTALFSAKMHCNDNVVALLLQNQAQIYHRNQSGNLVTEVKGGNHMIEALIPDFDKQPKVEQPSTYEDAMKLIEEAAQNLGKTESEIKTQPQEESTVQNESGGRQRTRNARLEVAIKKRSRGFTPNITPESRKIAADILTKV